MSANSKKMPITSVQGDILKCLVLSDKQIQNPQIFSAFLKRHLTAVAKHENIHVIAAVAS